MRLRRWFVIMVALVAAATGSAGAARAQAEGVYFNRADNTTVTDPVLNVSVMVCAPAALIYFTSQHFYTGGSTTLTPSGGSSWMSCEPGLYPQPYDVSMYLVSGTNQLWIDAGDGLSFEQSVGLTITYTEPPAPVDVSTSSTGAQMIPGSVVQRIFKVKNPATTSRSFTLSVTCSGIVTCTGMSQPGSVTVAAGATNDVLASYSVSGAVAATGSLTLTAVDVGYGDNTDNAVANIQIIPNPVIATRSLCLSTPAGPGASVECGTLRLAHSLPSVRTYSTVRAPVLTYESQQASPRPIFSIAATLPAGQPTPDSVVTTVVIKGIAFRRRVAGSQFPAGQARRAMIAIDLSADSTGLYDYTIEVRRFWSGGNSVLASGSGSMPIVNRATSYFGAGWWLSGIEQMKPLSGNRKLWIGGDGSTRVYEKVSTVGSDTVYMAARQTYSDTLRYTASDGSWKRRLPNGGFVKFNAQLRHVATTNRLNQSTTIAYDDSSRVAQITVPPSSAMLTYVFAYDAAGKIDYISVPGSPIDSTRVTQVTVDGSGRLTHVYDPGLSTAVVFGYDAGVTKLAVSRTDRRNGVVRFAYDSTQRVAQSRLKLNTTDSAMVRYCVAESMGMTACQTSLVAPTEVRTIIDGPRTDVPDTAVFWVDGNGAPTKIRNARGDSTSIGRGDPRFPALATRTRQADGHISSAAYDDRGNLVTAVDSSLNIGGLRSTTRYEWHTKWNQPTQITLPSGALTRADYDATTGNLSWQEDGRGSASRTAFEYDGSGLLRSSVWPGGARDSIYYDAGRWNVASTKSPVGRRSEYVTDSIGRVTVSRTLLGSGVTQGDTTSYDRLSRVTRQVTYSDPLNGVAAQRQIVVNTYDDESNLLTLTRTQSPNPTNLSSLVTSWTYDLGGRRLTEVQPGGRRDSSVYNVAGNEVERITRRGNSIYTTYDTLGRVARRIVHAATDTATYRFGATSKDTSEYATWNPPYGVWVLTRDTTTFEYDAMGRVVRAANRDGRIFRTYTAFGALERDSVWIRSWSRTAENAYGMRYEYDIAGRVTTLWYPSQLMDTTRAKTTYGYDATTGFLNQVNGLQNEQFSFAYNDRSQVTDIYMPGGINERLGYDGDGLMNFHAIENNTPSGLTDRFTPKWIDSSRVFINLRGQIDSVRNAAGPKDTLRVLYSGIGHVRINRVRANGVNMMGNPLTAAIADTILHDPMGNVYSSVNVFTAAWGSAGWFTPYGMKSSTSTSTSTFDASTGRITSQYRYMNTQSFKYDSAGNTVLSSLATSDPTAGDIAYDDRVSYYNGSGQLVQSERRLHSRPTYAAWEALGQIQRYIESYRYDPLGRRILVHSMMECHTYTQAKPMNCDIGVVRRTIWAGDRELVEIQRPAQSYSITEAQMESDTLMLSLPVRAAGTYPSAWDPNKLYGRVAYTHGTALDRPLSMTRFAYVDRWAAQPTDSAYHWPVFTFVPHWNARGEASSGTFSNGAARKRKTIQGDSREVAVAWPLGGLAYNRLAPDTITAWHGTLVNQKLDLVGTLYRRNRYYDPSTGRFTQQDPIGLAGGLNLYGYANGDPINFSDPFGLCPWYMKISSKRCARFDGLRPQDQEALAADGATALVQTARIASEAEALAGQHFPDQVRAPNLQWDAFKHIYGQCRVTQSQSYARARRLGDTHENMPGNPPAVREMDLRNNAIGRSIGMDQAKDCESETRRAIDSGQAWIAPGGTDLQHSPAKP